MPELVWIFIFDLVNKFIILILEYNYTQEARIIQGEIKKIRKKFWMK